MDRFGSNQNRSWPMGSLVTNTSSESIMTGPFGDNCKKRRVTDDIKDLLNEANQNQQSSLASGSKRFLPLPKCDRIFHTEDWKPRGTTMFMPLLEDILVNLKNLEQISFNHGTFFVADDSGNYSRSLSGRTVNLWRYCEQSRRMYICRAFLFISQQDFVDVQEYLQSL